MASKPLLIHHARTLFKLLIIFKRLIIGTIMFLYEIFLKMKASRMRKIMFDAS